MNPSVFLGEEQSGFVVLDKDGAIQLHTWNGKESTFIGLRRVDVLRLIEKLCKHAKIERGEVEGCFSAEEDT